MSPHLHAYGCQSFAFAGGPVCCEDEAWATGGREVVGDPLEAGSPMPWIRDIPAYCMTGLQGRGTVQATRRKAALRESNGRLNPLSLQRTFANTLVQALYRPYKQRLQRAARTSPLL